MKNGKLLQAPLMRRNLTRFATLWIHKNNSHLLQCEEVDAADLENTLDQIFALIYILLDKFGSSRDLFVPVVIYANRFVEKAGIRYDQLLNLFLASVIATIKYWDETVFLTNNSVAQYMSRSPKDVNTLERQFLRGLDYCLALSSEDTDSFLQEVALLRYVCPSEKAVCSPKQSRAFSIKESNKAIRAAE